MNVVAAPVSRLPIPRRATKAGAYLGADDTSALDTAELLGRLGVGGRSFSTFGLRRARCGHLAHLREPFRQLQAEHGRQLRPRNRRLLRQQVLRVRRDAVRLLSAHGFAARRVLDGVREWRLAGLPLETGCA